MEEKIDIEKINENIGILRSQLKQKMPNLLRAQKLNLLRDYLGEIEKEEEKVKYNSEEDKLEYSESITIAMFLVQELERLIVKEKEFEVQLKYDEIMRQQYYYLARYLYAYFAVAIEFGIEKAKQFLAPRTCVLNYINWELTKFYYKDRAIMTISMPQGTRENRGRKEIYGVGSWEKP